MTSRIATERLYRTVDGRVVREGDPAAACLLCAEGDEIPAGFDAPVKKQAAPAPNNKQAAPAPNKSKG